MGKYLYGIIELGNGESFGSIGLGNSEVYTLQYEDISAVVSDIPPNYKVEVEEAIAHEKVLLKIMETHAIIPAGFGFITNSEDEILNIVKRGRTKFVSMLEKTNNRLQINVKVSWDKRILAEILGENEEVRKLAAEVAKTASQPLKIELGRRVKSCLDERKKEYLKKTQSTLARFSNVFRENQITDQDTIINASFLVEREQEKDFYEKINELGREYEKKLVFLAVGPLPPYNFTKIKIKRMDFENLDNARKTLGLSREVSISEINSAYEHLARKYHPDLRPDDPSAEEKFKEIKNARDVLTSYCEHYLCSLDRAKVEETLIVQEETG